MLRQHVDLQVFGEDRPPTREEVMEGVGGADILLCLLCDPIDAEVMDRSERLALISNCAVGFNNIDIAAATQRGIPVTNVPGVLTHATADLAWALILGVARRIAEADRYVRDGRFTGWGPALMLGVDVHGMTMGVVGAGRIGGEVLRRGAGFGMTLLYHNRKRDETLESELGAKHVPLDELMKGSDFISLHTPLTDETQGLIGAEQIGAMKPTAFIINTARGEVVDEEALLDALEGGRIAGAGLDVYIGEPNVNKRFMALDNTVLLPHVGSGTVTSRESMVVSAAQNIIALVGGSRPENLVNPDVWEGRRKLG
jgi:glyoxylate reductase